MVNGFIALIVAGIISLSPAISNDVPERGRQEGAIHPWDTIMDNLDASDYSGTYKEDGKLHIAAVDKEAVLRAVLISGAKWNEIVIDPRMKYTFQQLLDAQDKLFDDRAIYDIQSIFIQPQNNRLTVGGPKEWTDARKQKVMDAVSMDNILFEYSDGILDIDEGGRPDPDWLKNLDWSRFDE